MGISSPVEKYNSPSTMIDGGIVLGVSASVFVSKGDSFVVLLHPTVINTIIIKIIVNKVIFFMPSSPHFYRT